MAQAPFQLPRDGATGEEVLKSLGAQFSLDDRVVQGLVQAKISHIEEFRYFFDAEDKIAPWITKLSLGDESNIQGARLRRAWAAVRLFYSQAEQDRSRVPTADLDAMLGDNELRDAKLAFWRRYKTRYPPELHPSDATVSRVSRELDKRMLCVYNVWKVKTLQFQLHTTQKRRKIGEGLYTEDVDESEPVLQDSESYLDRLHSLMLAYAIVGATAIQGGPTPGAENALGADSTRFVVAPLDVLMAYFLRAKRTSQQLPPGKRLAWLQARDSEERAEWVSRYRESTLTLGQVVKEIYATRDAHWIPVSGSLIIDPNPKSPAAGVVDKSAGLGPSSFALGKPVNGKKVARVLKDGTKLCAAFQHGQCKNKPPCPNGVHKCGVALRSERACGAPSHGASTCTQKIKNPS